MVDRITFEEFETKQAVENWAMAWGLVAEVQLGLHFEERFSAKHVHVLSAEDKGEILVLQLTTDKWQEPKDFALLTDGSLCW